MSDKDCGIAIFFLAMTFGIFFGYVVKEGNYKVEIKTSCAVLCKEFKVVKCEQTEVVCGDRRVHTHGYLKKNNK